MPIVDRNPPREASFLGSSSSLTGDVPKLAFTVPTNDETDQFVIYAFGTSKPTSSAVDAILFEHQDNGVLRLDLSNTSGSPSGGAHIPYTPYQKIVIAHAVFAAVGFLIFLPLGALYARYLRTFIPTTWFQGHWIIQFLLAGVSIVIGVALGIRSVEEVGGRHLDDNHKGTTLEECEGVRTSNTALWSAEALLEQAEDALVNAHLSFLLAGSRIISTATQSSYQCAPSTFNSAGIDGERASLLMRKAVQAAALAKRTYLEDPRCKDNVIFVALSVGPFGATLSPTQEFSGFYPPPYGPKKFTQEGVNVHSFDEETDEALAIKALADFHFDRLRIFSSDDDVWDIIDCIAMETVPLVREVIAIREAFCRLHQYLKTKNKPFKPWWISFVFPDGIPVERNSRILDYVNGALAAIPSVSGQELHLPVPSAIGINCVDVDAIEAALLELQQAVYNLTMATGSRPTQIPWLVIYPNGSHFDVPTREWSQRDDKSWAQQLTDIVTRLRHNSETPCMFPGIVIGGCCKAGPGKISQLSRALGDQHTISDMVKVEEYHKTV
ncbi:hypothetical protein CVT24_002588 [Panaeolus cyanescens]|uniref:Hcy-binding domain-containing protein n=1 Tax=Panaeolus cyanescens TaxID=181874 RepID=A0A409WB56_9AGAR|nr:hypothetical protein CVT24_002588 [Panaeolus cyanescens]